MNLVERVKRILLSPRTEWEVIDAEPTTTTELYTTYIAPLAAIGPVAQLIGFSFFGIPLPGPNYRVPIGAGLTTAIVSYVLTLAGTYVLALAIDALAPTFNGQRGQVQALKVAAYSSTAYWLAGIFALFPGLWILSVLGFALLVLYSFYLLSLGLPVLMKPPRDRALMYTGVVIVAGIVLGIVSTAIANVFLRVPGAAMMMP